MLIDIKNRKDIKKLIGIALKFYYVTGTVSREIRFKNKKTLKFIFDDDPYWTDLPRWNKKWIFKAEISSHDLIRLEHDNKYK